MSKNKNSTPITITYSYQSTDAGEWLAACWAVAGKQRLQSELCACAGVSRSHIHRVLQGERSLAFEGFESIKKAAVTLGLQPPIDATLLCWSIGLTS